MIPYLLAIAGGYLIAQSRKQDTFADGGTILSEDGTFLTLIDESNIGEKVIFDAQKKYIEQRNKIQARAMSSSSDMGEIYEDFESLLKKQLSAENLVSQKILPSKYNDYHFSFINSKSFGKATDKEGAMKLASRLNQMGYKSLIVPSVVVQINMNEPSLGKYIVYTDKPVSEKDLQNLGVLADGGMMADGGMTKPSAKRIANKLMKIESDIWDKLNIQSGSQLYGDNELQKKYARELEKSGADKMINQVDAQKVMDILEDNNYHSLYTYFIYKGVLGNGKRDVYVDMYNDGGSYMLLNPNLIEPK